MHSRIFSLTIVICILVFFSNLYAKEPNFPVEAEVFVAPFDQCEGIAFNGEGRLFVTGDQALHEIETDGTTHKIVDLYSNLGLAGIGERDLMVADFGLTNAFRASFAKSTQRHGKPYNLQPITPLAKAESTINLSPESNRNN